MANIYKIDSRHKVEIDLAKLHPWTKYKLCNLLNELAKKKIWAIVTSGYRSSDEQNKLYSQGRTSKGAIITNTRGGHSQHNWGIAVDLANNFDVDKDGKVTDDTWNEKGFSMIAKIAKSSKVGFKWGGDWSGFKDRPHFYIGDWGSTTQKLREKYGTYENFKKTWTCTVKCGTAIRKSKLFTSKHLKDVKAGTKLNLLWKSKLGYAKVEYNEIVGFIRVRNIK